MTRNGIGLWSTRTTSSGRFDQAKREGNPMRGARRDDRDNGPVYALAFLAGLGVVGLFLHSLGVFVP